MNNSLFEKSVDNLLDYRNIEFVTIYKRKNNLASEPQN